MSAAVLLTGCIVVLTVLMWVVYGLKVETSPSPHPSMLGIKSSQELTAWVFGAVCFGVLVLGLAWAMLPQFGELGFMLGQIGAVGYPVLFTVFATCVYTMVSHKHLVRYGGWIDLAMLCVGAPAFYAGLGRAPTSTVRSTQAVPYVNATYERVRYFVLALCGLTVGTTLYAKDPDMHNRSTELTLALTALAFLYAVSLVTLPSTVRASKQPGKSVLSAMSPASVLANAGFAAFLATVTALLVLHRREWFDPHAEDAEPAVGFAMLTLALLCSVCWVALLGTKLFTSDDLEQLNAGNNATRDMVQRGFTGLLGLGVSAALIAWVANALTEWTHGGTGWVSVCVNGVAATLLLGVLWRGLRVKTPGATVRNPLVDLLVNSALCVPCVVSDWFEKASAWVNGEVKQTEQGSVAMLVLAVALLVGYHYVPGWVSRISEQGGTLLVNQPVLLDREYTLATYESLNGGDGAHERGFRANYALSAWFYLDAVPPNAALKYREFSRILAYGRTLVVAYNAEQQALRVSARANGAPSVAGDRVVFEGPATLQKWTHVALNCRDGVVDVFVDGELRTSVSEVLPYRSNDALVVGQVDGPLGGLCNVVYFDHPLTAPQLYYVYHSVKDLTPPVLNDDPTTVVAHAHRG